VYQRILVPFDGSFTSNRGLDEAIKLAKLAGARLRLLYIVDTLLFSTGFEACAAYTGEMMSLMEEAGAQILREGKAHVDKAGVKVDTVLLEGVGSRLSDVVVDQIKVWGAELVVIGTHGRRGVGRLLLGSDAEQIVRNSPVPVLLVRAPAIAGDATVVKPASVAADATTNAMTA
jgi:nucleotide-binding universal stress UspA family protein